MTLVEFLLARIAEDEAEARQALDDLDLDGTGTGWSTSLGYDHNQLSAPGYVFTRRWSPERVLAECEAKQRLVEIAVGPWDAATINRAVDLNQRGSTVVSEDGEEEDVAEWTTTRLLRAIAVVYVDHPDYQPEWKP